MLRVILVIHLNEIHKFSIFSRLQQVRILIKVWNLKKYRNSLELLQGQTVGLQRPKQKPIFKTHFCRLTSFFMSSRSPNLVQVLFFTVKGEQKKKERERQIKRQTHLNAVLKCHCTKRIMLEHCYQNILEGDLCQSTPNMHFPCFRQRVFFCNDTTNLGPPVFRETGTTL